MTRRPIGSLRRYSAEGMGRRASAGDYSKSRVVKPSKGLRMICNRPYVFVLPAIVAAISFAQPAGAAKFDGSWSMTAVTTRGHCGIVPIGMGIASGRIHSTGGSFAFYPIQLGGRVSGSGRVQLKAVAGPRIAQGTGRLNGAQGSGTWSGRGPSGLCSGDWSATRS